MWPINRAARRQDRQAGRAVGAVVAAPMGKRAARAGLVQRIRGALVRRQVVRAVAQIPAGAALAVGLAVGIVIGVALVLGTISEIIREGASA